MIPRRFTPVNSRLTEVKTVALGGIGTPLHIIHPANAPAVTAGVVYQSPTELIFHSIRRQGVHQRTNAIQMADDVLTQLEQLGCEVVSVATNGRTYTTTVATIRQRGRWLTTANGVQLALNIKHWSTDGRLPEAEPEPAKPAAGKQLLLWGGD